MKYIASLFILLFLCLSLPRVLAQTPLFSKEPLPGNATREIHFPNLIPSFGTGNLAEDLFDFIVKLLADIGGLIAFGYILYGGYKYIMAGPNPAGAEEGKKMIVGAIVGLVIMALAYVLVLYVRNQLVNTVFKP
jgi:hypothetical protein